MSKSGWNSGSLAQRLTPAPSDFPRSPKLLKGALVVYIPNAGTAAQSDRLPVQLRAAQPHAGPSGGASPSPATSAPRAKSLFRVLGPPGETINLSVELNAADQLERSPTRTPWSSRMASIRRSRRWSCCSTRRARGPGHPHPGPGGTVPRSARPICP